MERRNREYGPHQFFGRLNNLLILENADTLIVAVAHGRANITQKVPENSHYTRAKRELTGSTVNNREMYKTPELKGVGATVGHGCRSLILEARVF